MNATHKPAIAPAAAANTLDPDILAAVIDETARRVEARAARPSPIHLRSWQEIERFAEKAAKSAMVPKDFIGKPDAICIAVQLGSELGLAPMQSIQNIAVINGRPTLWGDAMIGLCRASGVAAYIREWFEGEGDALVCYCEARRRDDPSPIRRSFSVADAKRAGLWKEEPKIKKQGRDGPYEVDSGPWYAYPQRMMQMRARGFCLRDAFPDVLKGLMSAEEARDIPWEDTGLSIGLPPVATAKSIGATQPRPVFEDRVASSRDATNAEVPLHGTAPPANGKTRHSIAPPPGAPDDAWRACLDKVGPALTKFSRLALVEEMADGPTCSDIVANGPGWARAELAQLLADNVARFRAEAEAQSAAEPMPDDELTIAGEEKVRAG